MRTVGVLVLLFGAIAYADELPPDDSVVVPTPTPPPDPVVARPTVEAPGAAIDPPTSNVTAFAPWQTARLILEVEAYTFGRSTRREGDDLSEVRLDRGELGGRVAMGKHAAVELRGETIRSALDGGAQGIDGDSTVLRLKLAQVLGSYELSGLRLEGAFGFVPDPWIRGLEEDYTLKPLSRTGSERLLGWAPVDLAGLVRAGYGPVRATLSIGNGEGQRFPERNRGKTTTALVDVVPVATDAVRLTASGVFRDGSVGVARIRERRVGGGLGVVTPWGRAGVELVSAKGVGDRGEAEGLMIGGWADARVIERLFVGARGQSLGFSGDGGRISSIGGAISYEPWREVNREGERARGRLRLWLAVERQTSSGGAMPLPGADAGKATLLMLVASATAPFTVE